MFYRWIAVGPDPYGTPIVVQAADGRGEKRVVMFQPGLNVTPSGVADAIRRLRADGWVPGA